MKDYRSLFDLLPPGVPPKHNTLIVCFFWQRLYWTSIKRVLCTVALISLECKKGRVFETWYTCWADFVLHTKLQRLKGILCSFVVFMCNSARKRVCAPSTCVVHHLESTGLCCAPSTCVVHHGCVWLDLTSLQTFASLGGRKIPTTNFNQHWIYLPSLKHSV